MNDVLHHNLNYKKYVIDPRLQYFKPHSIKIVKSFSDEICHGINRDSKYILPKFFYDKKGSNLFEQICALHEYYPTRIEISILKKIQHELHSLLDDSYRLVELGSGSSVKTRLILDVFESICDKIEYFPIDISEILTESSEFLLNDYRYLSITGIIDTYDGGLEFIKHYDDRKNLIIFLGSSFGNFSPSEGAKFLKKISSTMKKGDLFLIGLDLVKPKHILENAYNDSQGVTAKFNLNVLSRINDELDADFVLTNFQHYAIYNEKDHRIEMYLKSLVNQSVIIAKSNILVNLSKNELIHTEYSHKYKITQIENLLDGAGFKIKKMWTDDDKFFSLTLAAKK